ncbi:MAG: amidase [Betaproteobacteria bacterium]|nr:amidase [Betaproteobacteria bacterium]
MQPCDLSASEARFLIGAKKLSPVELLASCLTRIEAVNAQVNGVVAIDRERALREAREAERAVMRGDALGLLHGLPIGIKDLVDTQGLRTTYGSMVYKDQVPEKDAALVATLRRAGGIVCFKTNTPEWGAGGNTFNPVYGVSGNPFAPPLTCGGSSGGSAIALATGMLPLAHGSDNAGSLRIPASFCGITGMRPTAGLVPSETRPFGPTPLNVEGPMGRSARDVLLMLAAMASDNPRDPLAGHVDPALRHDLAPADLSRLRVAFTPDLGGFAPIESRLSSLFEARTSGLRGLFRDAANASPDFRGADRIYETLRAFVFVGTWQDRMREQPGKWGRLVTGNYEAGLKLGTFDIAEAHVAWTRLYRAAQDFFADCELLILPTTGVYPWPKHDIFPSHIGEHAVSNYIDWVRMTYAITLLNHPCISIPCGVDDRGLPFGLQLVARRGQDAFLMQAAMALEQVLAADPVTARPLPNLAWLAKQPVDDPLAKQVK